MPQLICAFKIKIKQFWTRVKNFTVNVSPHQKKYHVSVHADKVYEVNSSDNEFCVKIRQSDEVEDGHQERNDE